MARDAETGFELWREATEPAGDGAPLLTWFPALNPVLRCPSPPTGASLYFLNESPDTARSLRVSNGSEAGTVRLTPPLPLVEHALLARRGEHLLRRLQDDGGRELVIHRTSGSAATTVELARSRLRRTPSCSGLTSAAASS